MNERAKKFLSLLDQVMNPRGWEDQRNYCMCSCPNVGGVGFYGVLSLIHTDAANPSRGMAALITLFLLVEAGIDPNQFIEALENNKSKDAPFGGKPMGKKRHSRLIQDPQ